jgi:hypothetical protein
MWDVEVQRRDRGRFIVGGLPHVTLANKHAVGMDGVAATIQHGL